ncbi:MAG: aminotransferase class I/II-fold pyridoxal phosphate-dependent enzyme [Phycisphaerales bacterium]
MSSESVDPQSRAAKAARKFNAAQLRLDTWNEFQTQVTWLKEYAKAGRDRSEPKALITESLELLASLEHYWAFPGMERMQRLTRLFEREEHVELAAEVSEIARLLVGDAYRERGGAPLHMLGSREDRGDHQSNGDSRENHSTTKTGKPYFEVLVVDGVDAYDHAEIREGMLSCRRESDEFVYDVVTVPSLEDTIIAVLFNPTIQAVFLRYNFAYASEMTHPALRRYLEVLEHQPLPNCFGLDRSMELGKLLHKLRPELDLYLVTDTPLESVAGNLGSSFRRAFYRLEQYMEQHLSILQGVRKRFEAPFFDALRRYSSKPTGVFHALPIARGKSMANSHWAKDLLSFYGPNIFMAETSATSGGLDSLLQPRGPIKKAQDAAARAFGARHTFFVTNGTSTANKIVSQALIQPGDIVLIDRDCHKSHHYAMVLSGAMPVYLDSYPLTPYAMYGAVPLKEIEDQLLELKDAGKLDRVRMVVLTNCTFDGLTYDTERVMRRILAIKPDMIFLWDEAWFAFARFEPVLRRRTGMDAASRLRAEFQSDAYRAEYERKLIANNDVQPEGMPDPDRVRLRVYVTQSTHKTLTSLRQGSMIHVYDEDFEQRASQPFNEAFMTHTSTSPNYQIVASLDVGRRQVELEGYEQVDKTIGLAMTLRERVREHSQISKVFSVLRPADMIPAEFRPSGLEYYYDPQNGWGRMDEAWRMDEFTLDPTRVTLQIAATGMNGDDFRHLLMDQYDIQINKTSRNTALFMPNIGTSRGDVAYLIEVLARISTELQDRLLTESSAGLSRHSADVDALLDAPPLPNFSRFHHAYQSDESGTPEGDLRRAYFDAYEESNLEWVRISSRLLEEIRSGRVYVSASFVTPYPPGFPLLVPGQVVSAEIIEFLLAIDVKEIHGYHSSYGFRVFTDESLDRAEHRSHQNEFSERGSIHG